jgi:hypothetical protein
MAQMLKEAAAPAQKPSKAKRRRAGKTETQRQRREGRA